MKKILFFLLFINLLYSCPPLPNHIGIFFNKKGISLDIKKLQSLAKKEQLQIDFIKENNITEIIFKKGDYAYSKDGKAIIISAKRVKELLQKAYKDKILQIDKKDLQEIKKSIFSATNIFFQPKKCKLNKEEQWQVAYKSKTENIKSGHWYAVENNCKLDFSSGCPKIKVYR